LKKYQLVLAAASALFAMPGLFGQQGQLPRCDLVPGWTQAGPFRTYVADNLYDYMNGNSEGYLIYGFQKMNGVTCKKGDASFVFDISEMPDPESAWGLYASNRDIRMPAESSLGMGGQIVPQRGIFCKGKYFVEISAGPPSVDHSANIRAFLKAVEPLVAGSNEPPAPLSWFPAEGLDPASIRLIPQSVLGLSVLKRGYMAKYEWGRAFVVRDPSPDAAKQTAAKLKARFGDTQPASAGDEAFTGTDKYLGRLVVVRKGQYVAGFVNVKEGMDPAAPAKTLVDRIR
jgi:hypothetical protein